MFNGKLLINCRSGKDLEDTAMIGWIELMSPVGVSRNNNLPSV